MDDRKMTIRRLVIFLIGAFVLANVPQLIYFSKYSYYDEQEVISSGTSLLLAYSMLAPAMAVLFARAVTKEGFSLTGRDSMMLGISFRQRRWVFYLVAIITPWFLRELEGGLEILLFQGAFALKSVDQDVRSILVFLPVLGMTQGVIGSVGGLGEELGWRGYMMPKLEKLFGIRAAVLIGGVIWGVWHYVAIYNGHNFGVDYVGAPWSGMLVFTVFAVFENAFLTYLTKRTGSVWPAAFSHAVNNTGIGILVMLIDWEKVPDWERTFGVMGMLPLVVVGIYCFFRLRTDRIGANTIT